jgi:hypothetical protein
MTLFLESTVHPVVLFDIFDSKLGQESNTELCIIKHFKF